MTQPSDKRGEQLAAQAKQRIRQAAMYHNASDNWGCEIAERDLTYWEWIDEGIDQLAGLVAESHVATPDSMVEEYARLRNALTEVRDELDPEELADHDEGQIGTHIEHAHMVALTALEKSPDSWLVPSAIRRTDRFSEVIELIESIKEDRYGKPLIAALHLCNDLAEHRRSQHFPLTETAVKNLADWMNDGDGGLQEVTLHVDPDGELSVSVTEYPEEGAMPLFTPSVTTDGTTEGKR